MKNFFLTIFCVLIVFFQLSVAGAFFVSARIPDLALALVITLVVATSFKESFRWIMLTGLLLEAGSNAIFGATILVLVLISWAVSGAAKVADIRSKKTFFLFFLALMTALAQIVKDLAMVEIAKLKIYYMGDSTYMYSLKYNFDYAIKTMLTVFATFIIYYFFRRITRYLFFKPVGLGVVRR